MDIVTVVILVAAMAYGVGTLTGMMIAQKHIAEMYDGADTLQQAVQSMQDVLHATSYATVRGPDAEAAPPTKKEA